MGKESVIEQVMRGIANTGTTIMQSTERRII